MTRPRRRVSAFSLSFLDIMSCGFGAAVLLFLIIKHKVDTTDPIPVPTRDLTSEVMLLEEEIIDGKKNLAVLRNTIGELNDEIVVAQGLARRVMEEIKETAALTEEINEDANDVELEKLKTQIKKLETQKIKIEEEVTKTGEDVLKLVGEGNRQYLTGLKLGANRNLILLDVSASMLDRTVVNILRFRNMRDERKRLADKWINTIEMVEWLAAKLPINSQFQIYLFNDKTTAAITDSKGRWLSVSDKGKVAQAIENIKNTVPEQGTNLEQAFAAAAQLNPKPDNIYLITDGLPTQGSKTWRGATISPNQRLSLFNRAKKRLPGRVPVNIILKPMEGDNQAAYEYWKLASETRGSFMSPTEDWP